VFDNDRADFIDGKKDLIIQIKGHSLLTKNGTDIVCSAVSALAQTMVVSITRICGIKQKVLRKDGLLRTQIKTGKLETDEKKSLLILVNSFMIGIKEIKKVHPENLEIEVIS
jgi:hypothetical protein